MLSRTFHNARLSRPVTLVAAVLLAALAVLASAPPAHAHDELLGSDPAAGATVDGLPAELRLTFSGVIAAAAGASEVQVTDAEGTSLTEGESTAQDNVLSQPLSGEASGAVTVLWKVVSSDGHPISGEFSFTVAGAPEPTETASPAPTETTAPSETVEPTQTAEPTPPADESGSADVWPWIVLALLGLAAVAALVYVLVSRGRRDRQSADGGDRTAGDDGPPGSEPPAAH